MTSLRKVLCMVLALATIGMATPTTPVLASDSAMTRGEFAQYFAPLVFRQETIDESSQRTRNQANEAHHLYRGTPYYDEIVTLHERKVMFVSNLYSPTEGANIVGNSNDSASRDITQRNSVNSDNVGDKEITKGEVLYSLAKRLYSQELNPVIDAHYSTHADPNDVFTNSVFKDCTRLGDWYYPNGLNYQGLKYEEIPGSYQEKDSRGITQWYRSDGTLIQRRDNLQLVPNSLTAEQDLSNMLRSQSTSGTVWFHIYHAARILQEHGINVKESDGNVNWSKTMSRAEIEDLTVRALKVATVDSQSRSYFPQAAFDLVQGGNTMSSNDTSATEIKDNTPMINVQPTADIKVTVNGTQVKFDQPPVVINGRTMVPVAGIFEALGIPYNWEGTTRTVTATQGGTTLVLIIDSPTVFVNSAPHAIDTAPTIVNGRTLVPARVIGDAFGKNVNWNEGTRTVEING